jgi:hypothetical protein
MPHLPHTLKKTAVIRTYHPHLTSFMRSYILHLCHNYDLVSELILLKIWPSHHCRKGLWGEGSPILTCAKWNATTENRDPRDTAFPWIESFSLGGKSIQAKQFWYCMYMIEVCWGYLLLTVCLRTQNNSFTLYRTTKEKLPTTYYKRKFYTVFVTVWPKIRYLYRLMKFIFT